MFFAAPQGFLFSPFTPSRWLSQLTVVQEHFFLPHYPIAATNVSLPAAYCASPVQPSSVIIALPSSATLLKSTHFPLIPNLPKHLSCFISFTCHTTSSHDLLFPNLFNTDGVNDEIKWEGQKLLIHFLFFFSSLVFKGKKSKHNLKDWIWLKLHWRGQSVPAQKVVGQESKQKQIVYLLL